MKAPSKKLIIIMIAVILLFVIIAAVMPDREVTKEKANLIVSIDTNIPVGSVQVNFTRWDGSLSSEAVMNADGSMMGRGAEVGFEVTSWPATVYVYADQQGTEVLTAIVIETAPEDDGIWKASVYDSEMGLTVSLE